MKKLISLFLAFVLTVPFIQFPANAATLPFKDVPTNAWYYDGVEYAYRKGLLVGTSKNQFSPDQTISRGMLATILHRLVGKPKPNASYSFNDVGYRTYYRDAINWADSRGIANGTSDGTFSPDAAVSREQLATMLYRYAVLYEGMDGQISISLNNFSDANRIGEYAQKAMGWCVTKGLISGKGNNILDPQGTATRAEVSTILLRFSQLPSEKGIGYKDVIERAMIKPSNYAQRRSTYYDIDNDGEEELFLLNVNSNSSLEEETASLYSKNNEGVVTIIDSERLMILAGGGGGDFGVIEKDGHTYVALTSENSGGHDGRFHYPYGYWKLYEIQGNRCILETNVNFRLTVFLDSSSSVVEDESEITINGSTISYAHFHSWENSLKWKAKLHANI